MNLLQATQTTRELAEALAPGDDAAWQGLRQAFREVVIQSEAVARAAGELTVVLGPVQSGRPNDPPDPLGDPPLCTRIEWITRALDEPVPGDAGTIQTLQKRVGELQMGVRCSAESAADQAIKLCAPPSPGGGYG